MVRFVSHSIVYWPSWGALVSRCKKVGVGNVNKHVKWADETKPTYADIASGASGRRTSINHDDLTIK